MKTFLLSLSFLVLYLVGTAQEKDTNNENFKVNYAQSSDTKNSDFIIENDEGFTYVKGQLKDNKPSAEWTCYNKQGNVTLKYDFDGAKILYLDKKSILSLDYVIDARDGEVQKSARIPVLVSSFEYYKQVITSSFKEVLKTKVRGQGGIVNAKFDALIDKKGKAKYIVTYSLNNLTYNLTIFPEVDKAKIYWLPAVYNGQNYDSEASFSAEFVFNPSTYRRTIWTY